MRPSLSIIAHATVAILKLSIQALWHNQRGGLTTQVADEALHNWSKQMLQRIRLKVTIDGLELIPKERPLIVISNHLSLYDIPVTYEVLPLSLRMAGKSSLFKIPIWGHAMRAAGFVEIDRSVPQKARETLKRAGEQMKLNQVCLQIAPEGTRSADGKLQRFKRGAFELALTTGFKVVPLLIDGTDHVLKKGSLTVQQGQKVHLRVLAPIDPREFDDGRVFADYAHDLMGSALKKLRSEPPSFS